MHTGASFYLLQGFFTGVKGDIDLTSLSVYVQKRDKSIIDLTAMVREHLGLAVITEQDRLDAIESGIMKAMALWPDEDADMRVWCHPQVPGSEHLYGPRGEIDWL